MKSVEELKLILTLIQKYELPLSPILEYAIKEKCEAFEKYGNGLGDSITIKEAVMSIQHDSFCENNHERKDYNQSFVRENNVEIDRQNLTMVREGLYDDDDNSVVVFTHAVDWSPFEYGFAINRKYHDRIFQHFGYYIERGSGVPVNILFKGKTFEASITNEDSKSQKGDAIRLLYSGKYDTLGSYLKKVVPDIYHYIKSYKEANRNSRSYSLPLHLRKTMVLKRTENPSVFSMTLIDE